MTKLGPKKLAMYGLMIAGALTGLIVDRMRGPASAEAAPVAPGFATPAVQNPQSPADTPRIDGPPIARVFEASPDSRTDSAPAPDASALSDASAPRDAFALTPEMQDIYIDQPVEEPAKAEEAARNEAELARQALERFVGSHQLKGTTLADDVSWAIINDRVVRVGERIGGFELVKVERYRVILQNGPSQAVLSLQLP